MKKMIINVCRLAFIFFFFSIFFTIKANQPLSIPEDLTQWKGWVLKGYEESLCPVPYNNGDNHFCVWPGDLNLNLVQNKAQFTQKVAIYAQGWVPLVGDKDNWPENVKVNNQLFPVSTQDGRPAVFLEPGEYQISGEFSFEKVPEFLQVPSATGVITLTVDGQMFIPDRDNEGKIWLNTQRQKRDQAKEEDSLNISVFRLLQDQIPMVDNTLLRLKVSGQIREVTIGPVQLANTAPLEVMSPLPGRLEEDGSLRLQIKPGVWDITVKSRFLAPVENLVLQKHNAPWPKDEVWSFQSQNDLRLVDIDGPVSLDPQQTDLPEAWRQYPAYLMTPETTFHITQKRRGQEVHSTEQVTLQRKMWLDFSGKGWTVQDNLTGSIQQHWRLSQLPPYELGRVTIDGQDKLITQMANNDLPGIEIRHGQLNLESVSRVPFKTSVLPAVGWDLDVQRLSTTLNLPPGWMLLSAFGVDTASHAWVQDWTLLDLFLVLVIAASVLKLLGIKWGLIALLTLVLTYQEPNAPIYSWLNLIIAFALLKALPMFGRAHTVVLYYFRISIILLLIIALPFMVQQIRNAIYPQLTYPNATEYVPVPMVGSTVPKALMEQAARAPGAAAMDMMGVAPPPNMKMKPLMEGSLYEQNVQFKPMEDYDPSAKIQTGPGVPTWQWNNFQLDWNGPVLKDQKLRLWLLPAWLTSILKVLQVILMGFLIYGLCQPFKKYPGFEGWNIFKRKEVKSFLVSLLCLSLWAVTLTPSNALADFPDQPLLDELRNRLLEGPDCLPDCASASKMQIVISPTQLTIHFTANMAEKTAIPLPGTLNQWMPRTILVNNQPSHLLKLDEKQQLWLQLEKGVQEVTLEGPIAAQDHFEITVPLKPKNIILNGEGWDIAGVFRQQLQGENLYFTRLKEDGTQNVSVKGENFEPAKIPPFVVLTRTLRLGFDWEIVNELKRIAPAQGAIFIELPLLPDEFPLSEQVEIKEGKVAVSLAQNQESVLWSSRLKVKPQIELVALNSPNVKEIWQLNASTRWHCTFEGIPTIHQRNQLNSWFPTWEPWPSEKLIIQIERPTAVPGNTLTLDQSRLFVAPGKHLSNYALSFTARSSQGENYVFKIPPDAQLQDVLIDGLSQPINAHQGEITVPLNPATQKVEVKWQGSQGVKMFYRTPLIDFQRASENDYTDLELSKNRWILFLGGPVMGPAVLFWGVLIVVFGVALALGRSQLTPLKTWEWFLLGVGITLATPLAGFIVVAWFIAMQYRSKISNDIKAGAFQWMQIGLFLLTLLFVVSFFTSISKGLLGIPEMQLRNPLTNLVQSYFNSPTQYQLQWYQDAASSQLARVWVISVPLYIYRIFMLLWALWFAFSLVKWLRWGWECYSHHGYWRSKPKPSEVTPPK